jgi:hypothetical protein
LLVMNFFSVTEGLSDGFGAISALLILLVIVALKDFALARRAISLACR